MLLSFNSNSNRILISFCPHYTMYTLTTALHILNLYLLAKCNFSMTGITVRFFGWLVGILYTNKTYNDALNLGGPF